MDKVSLNRVLIVLLFLVFFLSTKIVHTSEHDNSEIDSWIKIDFYGKKTYGVTKNELKIIHEEKFMEERLKEENQKLLLIGGYEVKDQAILKSEDGLKNILVVILCKNNEKYGEKLSIFSIDKNASYSPLFEKNIADLKPWKVLTGDFDGDGKDEIILGVYKKTRFDPELKNRLFVYNWTESELQPKWLGSSLAAPFYDFSVGCIDGDRIYELISLEKLKNGIFRVMVYEWNQFGFIGEEEWRSKDRIRELNLIDGNKDGKNEIYIKR